MSQLTRNLIRPGIPASLSGPPVLSVVLRAMDPGCHKRNVPDLSRMSTHYHVPLKIHCYTLAHITTCHLQYIATQTSLQQLGLHLWNEKTHYHLLHILHCQICYITAQSFFQQMHTYNFGIVHICTRHTRLTLVCMYTFFSLLSFLRKMDVTGPHFALEQVKWSTRWSMPSQSTCKGLHSTSPPGDCDALSLWRDISTACHFISSNFPWNCSNPFLTSKDI